MKVLNVHEREIPVSAEEVGALLNSLSSGADALWPRTLWPLMRLDHPLGVGASGGHGPVRYAVEEFIPGHRVKFRFSGPRGFNGFHRFEVVPMSNGGTILRHTIDMEVRGIALLVIELPWREVRTVQILP